jgi:hypothetical protein
MSWMKYVAFLAQDDQNLVMMKHALKKAKDNNLNYVIFKGDVLTTEQAEGIIEILQKDAKIRRESNLDVQ